VLERRGKERKGKEGISSARDLFFDESEIFNKEVFREKLKGNQYESANIDFYHESINNWSHSKNEKKIDWIAAAKNWMLRDMKDGKFVTNDQNLSKNGTTTRNFTKPARKTATEASRDIYTGGGEMPDFLKGK
jgi:hypothetical protein